MNIHKVLVTLIVPTFFTLFYGFLFNYLLKTDFEDAYIYNIYSYSYGSIAIVGSIFGLISSRHWGYYKSQVGLAVIAISLGLLLQGLGQFAYAYLALVVQTEELYPSIAEFFFVPSIIMYIIGSYFIAKVVGLSKSFSNKKVVVYSLGLAILLLFFAYYKFISEHDAEANSPLLILLEIVYPFGQSAFVYFAFIGLLLIRNVFGGKMAVHVLLIFLGLISQFFADTLYLKLPEQYSDLLYIGSYIIMSIALVYFDYIPQIGVLNTKKNNGNRN